MKNFEMDLCVNISTDALAVVTKRVDVVVIATNLDKAIAAVRSKYGDDVDIGKIVEMDYREVVIGE